MKKSNSNTIITTSNNENESKINNINGTEAGKIVILPLEVIRREKKKNFLKYLFWFLTDCLALICIYFFITSTITEAVITLIITVIMFVASILITKYNTKKTPQDKIKTTVQSSDNGIIIQRSKDLSLDMFKKQNVHENDKNF